MAKIAGGGAEGRAEVGASTGADAEVDRLRSFDGSAEHAPAVSAVTTIAISGARIASPFNLTVSSLRDRWELIELRSIGAVVDSHDDWLSTR